MLTPTPRLSAQNAGGTNTYITPSITHTPGDLLLVAFVYNLNGAPAGAPSLSGLGITWSQVAQAVEAGSDSDRLVLFAGRDAGALGSGALTFVADPVRNIEGVNVQAVEWAGAHTDWLVQVVPQATSGLATTFNLSLAAFVSANNAGMCVLLADTGDDDPFSIVPVSGETEVYEAPAVAPARFRSATYRTLGDGLFNLSSTAAARWAGAAVEIRDAASVTVINPAIDLPGTGAMSGDADNIGIIGTATDLPGVGDMTADAIVNTITPVPAAADFPGVGDMTVDATLIVITVINPEVAFAGVGAMTTEVQPIVIPVSAHFPGVGGLDVDAEGPPPSIVRGGEPYRGNLGCGNWRAFIQTRGGASMLCELPFVNVEVPRVLNTTGRASVGINVPRALRNEHCVAALNDLKAWKHELALYRDGEEAWVGPIVEPRWPRGNVVTVTLAAADGFQILERRLVEQPIGGTADLSRFFEAIFMAAIARDNSFGLDLIITNTGKTDTRTFEAEDRLRAADELRRLAADALDFTVVGRTVIAGPPDALSPHELLIWEPAMGEAVLMERGLEQANEFTLTGEPPGQSKQPLVGTATGDFTEFGLLQMSGSEPRIEDTNGIFSAAESRLSTRLVAPRVIEGNLTTDAPFPFSHLIPGSRCDVQLAFVGRVVTETMRLMGVRARASESAQEQVEITLGPLGGDEDG